MIPGNRVESELVVKNDGTGVFVFDLEPHGFQFTFCSICQNRFDERSRQPFSTVLGVGVQTVETAVVFDQRHFGDADDPAGFFTAQLVEHRFDTGQDLS